MPRVAVEDYSRVAMRIRAADKAKLLRAVAIEQTDITGFILRNALREADRVIERAEHVTLSEQDTRRWLELLDNPPKANIRLVAAAQALPDE